MDFYKVISHLNDRREEVEPGLQKARQDREKLGDETTDLSCCLDSLIESLENQLRLISNIVVDLDCLDHNERDEDECREEIKKFKQQAAV